MMRMTTRALACVGLAAHNASRCEHVGCLIVSCALRYWFQSTRSNWFQVSGLTVLQGMFRQDRTLSNTNLLVVRGSLLPRQLVSTISRGIAALYGMAPHY